jgi:hypothetical protein
VPVTPPQSRRGGLADPALVSTWSNFTATRLLTPCSCIVTPYSTSQICIVRLWWVMTMNWLMLRNSWMISPNRWLFASSSGASTSSRMQNGLGLLLKMLISSAMQVIAFSPPESWLIVAGFLPGGWARISIPASSGSIASSPAGASARRAHDRLQLDLGLQEDVGLAAAEQLAEHALEVLADGRQRLLEPQPALDVDLLDQLLELPLAVGQVGHLLAQERRPLLQLVLLGDRVEVHVPSRWIFSLSSLISRPRRPSRRRGRGTPGCGLCRAAAGRGLLLRLWFRTASTASSYSGGIAPVTSSFVVTSASASTGQAPRPAAAPRPRLAMS